MVAAWCQSKHVRLITKCYPPRTANPPKPNSSELSYLTYYAYTTPSKLKKVGKYLEHRAEKGLTKGRTGDVTVTLDICTALIKKCFRDLGLFASNIVAILVAVVKDGELVLVEHSVLTLKAFCSHHDGKLLTISKEFRAGFHALCKSYAQYGVGQDDMRAQYASLDALSALISSEAFHSTTAGGQLKIIVPALVQILALSSVPLQTLQSKVSQETLSPFDRRQSFFSREASVSQAPGTGTPRSSLQVDFSEEENSILALKNLKQVCETNNASLIRLGLDYLMDKLASLTSSNATDDYPAWTVELVTLVLTWLPIQHRYLCVSASLEDLDAGHKRYQDKAISTPKQQLILTILEGILTTGESLIGLNVMDVLNLLIDKIAIQISLRPTTKIDVIQKLVNCIVGLAGHVYYTDQIRDMCSSIMEWSRPLLHSLNPISGKDSPATEGEEDVQDVKSAALWSLRILKGVLSKGGGSVGLEEVWRGTEGGLAGREGEVRIAYVDALTTHIRSEELGEEEVDGAALGRFLTMIHVPVYEALKATEASATDYWAVWVLLLVLLKRFEVKEVIKVLPMKWRLLDVAMGKCSREQTACIEAIFLGFLAIVSASFKIPELQGTVSKEIDIRKTLDEWPPFIDPDINPAKITLHDVSSTSLVLPNPSESARPLPADLQRTVLVNTLAFCNVFPENLREHLLVQWSEETTMPDQLSFTPDSHSARLNESHRADTKSLSTRSRSVEDNPHHLLHPRQKSLSRRMERSPSPTTNIDQLRRVLAGGGSIHNRNSTVESTVPQIEINGEKVVTPSRESVDTPNEKGDITDVSLILESLNVNGDWNEKTTMDQLNGKVENGIKPPYGI